MVVGNCDLPSLGGLNAACPMFLPSMLAQVPEAFSLPFQRYMEVSGNLRDLYDDKDG